MNILLITHFSVTYKMPAFIWCWFIFIVTFSNFLTSPDSGSTNGPIITIFLHGSMLITTFTIMYWTLLNIPAEATQNSLISIEFRCTNASKSEPTAAKRKTQTPSALGVMCINNNKKNKNQNERTTNRTQMYACTDWAIRGNIDFDIWQNRYGEYANCHSQWYTNLASLWRLSELNIILFGWKGTIAPDWDGFAIKMPDIL